MYSDDVFNAHLLLRYGYTMDFFEWLSPLAYRGIELPLLMAHSFQVLIREQVDRLMRDKEFCARKQRLWGLFSMKDVQQKLQRLPSPQENWGKDPSRDMILMCGRFVDFALSQFPDRRVLLLHTNGYDLKELQGKTLPPGFQVFSIYDRLLHQSPIPADVNPRMEEIIVNRATRKDRYVAEHEAFSIPDFEGWLRGYLHENIILVNMLDDLLHQYPIGLILDHSEYVYPGNILALLARKYGLPFINVEWLLTYEAGIIPSRATHYAVWGAQVTDWLVKRGIDKDQIYEVGSLRAENNLQAIRKTRKDLLDTYRLSDRPIVVHTTENYRGYYYTDRINYEVMRWLTEAAAALNILVVIKPHPDDTLSYEAFLSDRVRMVPPGFHLQEVLNAADFVATISSTTAIEAAVLNKGLLVLQPDLPYNYHVNYNGFPAYLVRSEAGAVIRSAEEIVSELKRLIEDRYYADQLVQKGQRFRKYAMREDDEKPSERLGKLVNSLLTSR